MACTQVLIAQALEDAVDVMEAIYNRRSMRAYAGQPVDKLTVEVLIKAAPHASSSMNEQPWAFAVIQNPTQLAAWLPIQRRAPENLCLAVGSGCHP